MIDPVGSGEERRVPISPQLAVRVAVMGGVAFLLFAIIFFRLWYLQILSGDQYVQQANLNRVRDVAVPAPRGDITDRSGQPIVTSRVTSSVQVELDALPATRPGRVALYDHLAPILQISPTRLAQLVDEGRMKLPYADVTVKTDVDPGIRAYLAEHAESFPGVVQREISVRDYPFHDLAAQVLGYVGQINPAQLKAPRYRGVPQGTIVGQAGIEASYDRYLRGVPGAQRVQVDAAGQSRGELSERMPIPGHQLRLTVDLGLQREAEKALQQGIGLAAANGNPASAGAFVALDPRNGQVLALGSSPSYDPNRFVRPLTQQEYVGLTGSSGTAPGPLFDRATDGQYPTGSTFKPISAIAGLGAGLITPSTAMGGGSCVTIGRESFCNAGKVDDGNLTLRDALKVSEDTYFYQLGQLANRLAPHGGAIQAMARRLGLGSATGIDVPGEAPGNIPDPAWRARLGRTESACERRRHVPSCGISDMRPWSVGDNVQLAVGQGDVEATPLQMAVVYSALADAYMHGGRGAVSTPHLGLEVDDAQGRLLQRIAPPPSRRVQLDPSALSVVMDGLHAATSEPGGTSADVWHGFPRTVYGKTGTAQHSNQADQAWYVCYLPDPNRPIVIAVTVEQGGFGDQAAAPVARLMASEWFHQPLKVVAGSSATR